MHYGAPRSFGRLLWLIVKFGFYNLLPNGKSIKGYGTHTKDFEAFMDDWRTLFQLLEERKIKPIIAARYPILEAAQANHKRTEARAEAEIGRERALCDSPPHCYKPALDEAERLLKEADGETKAE